MDSAPFNYGRQNAQHIAAASIHSYYKYMKNSGELQWGDGFFDSHLCKMIAICDTYFNPRLRGEATLNKQEIRLSLDGFQSTPPRGRRPAFPFFEAAVRDISIHASAREATVS